MSQNPNEKGRYRLARVELSEGLIREALAPLEARITDLEAANAKVEIERLTEMARMASEIRERASTPLGPR